LGFHRFKGEGVFLPLFYYQTTLPNIIQEVKQAKLIYETNLQAINSLLIQKGYKPTFNDLMKAVSEKGDGFILELFNDITSEFSNVEGNFWTKFKNVFHKASDVLETTGKISGVADGLLNPKDNSDKSKPYNSTPDKAKWRPNLVFWGIGAALIILILVVIYIFKK
jgi:hypothetical protein